MAGIERDCGLDVTDEEAVSELKFGLTEVVYYWAQGEVRALISNSTIVLVLW